MGGQAWLNDDSQISNTKWSVKVKSNTSMHQAITNLKLYIYIFRMHHKVCFFDNVSVSFSGAPGALGIVMKMQTIPKIGLSNTVGNAC